MKVRMFDTTEAYENWSDKKWEENGCYDFLCNCLCAVYKTIKFDDGTTWGGFDCDMEVYGVKKISTAVKRFAKALREAGLIRYAEYVEEYWEEGCVNTYTENGFAFEIEETSDDTFYIRLAMVQNEMTVEADASDFIIENGVLKAYTGKEDIVTIPNDVTEIGRHAFYDCISMKKLIMSDSVIKVGSYAFCYCTELKEIILSSKLTKISYQCFRDCSSLKKITLSAGVTEIRSSAFLNCKALETIVIPDNVVCIGSCVFVGCKSLQTITIPESVIRIGYGAFNSCEKLQSITLPNGVTNIEGGTFENCISLQSIKISDKVTRIGDGAFYKCNLKSIKGCYKAFQVNENGHLQCRDIVFNEKQEPQRVECITVCHSGYHYCTNLYEIFNFYKGELDVDIVIYEIEPLGATMSEKNSSKCCCQSFKFKKRLFREDVIRILNGGSI